MKEDHPPLSVGPQSDACDALLRELAHEPVAPMSPGEARSLRARVVARLDTLQSRQMRRVGWGSRGWRMRALVAAAAGAAAMLVGSWWGFVRSGRGIQEAEVTAIAGEAAIARAGRERPLPNAHKAFLDRGDELRTGPSALARASLPTGAQVEVGPSSRLRFEREDDSRLRDRIELVTGRIDVQVPKLAEGNEVRVHTEDATVVVHGTRFSVERSELGETRVAVTEGRVAVLTDRGERILLAGSAWVVPSSIPVEQAQLQDSPPPPDPVTVADAEARDPSTLSAENALLADAIRLERTHRNDQALARLDDLLTVYPASPLAETARVERMRVLQVTGSKARLQREGARYLADFPHGFARQEVTHLMETAKASHP